MGEIVVHFDLEHSEGLVKRVLVVEDLGQSTSASVCHNSGSEAVGSFHSQLGTRAFLQVFVVRRSNQDLRCEVVDSLHRNTELFGYLIYTTLDQELRSVTVGEEVTSVYKSVVTSKRAKCFSHCTERLPFTDLCLAVLQGDKV